MVAKVMVYDFSNVGKQVNELVEIACKYQDREVVKRMKQLVPDYISNNSVYEDLDQKAVAI
jgi:ferritin